MLPLNMAILDVFTDGSVNSRADVQEKLRANYGNFKAFKDASMDDALQTAMSNGLIAEDHYEVESDGYVKIWYKSDKDMIDVINSYIR
ncbi:MAG: hypothetical protein K5767_06835 [Clostridia bacterium]|nr:hypothetical protein [Clostridia bacterium]